MISRDLRTRIRQHFLLHERNCIARSEQKKKELNCAWNHQGQAGWSVADDEDLFMRCLSWVEHVRCRMWIHGWNGISVSRAEGPEFDADGFG